MSINREVKIGAVALFTMIIMFFIFNYLKGKNIFSSNRYFFAIYSDVNRLAPSKEVYLNGFQVGRVDEIFFHPKNDGRLIVKISVNKPFQFTNQTKMQIYEDGFIKGAAIKLILSEKGKIAQTGDTLQGEVAPSITDIISKEVNPLKEQIKKATVSLDQTLVSANKLLDDENRNNIKQILKNINDLVLTIKLTATSISKTSESANQLFESNSNKVSDLLDNTNSLITKTELAVGTINNKVEKMDIEKSVTKLNASLEQMQSILTKINTNQGSMGKLINDPQLYDSLTKTSLNLQELLADIKANPKRYVKISVF